MIKQLRKVGNSNALILDKPIMELLGLEEDGQVQLTIQDGTPHRDTRAATACQRRGNE